MKREDNLSMPPELREEVARQAPADRQQIEQVWHLLGRTDGPVAGAPSTDAAWEDLQGRLTAEGDAPPVAPLQHASDRAPVRVGVRLRLVLGAAAGMAAVLVVGLWLWRQPVTVSVPAGRQHTVHLPDGSTVALNSATRLRHARSFECWPFVPAAERVVQLEGEAFFDVAHTGRPFVVETFNARVEVLGTTFNVRARRGASADAAAETQVTLASGRVRVTAPGRPGDAVTLTDAGYTALVGDTARAASPVTLRHLPAERVFAWRHRGFAAVDQPLAAILAEVERRYALRIETEGGLDLADPMNVWYQGNTTAENILHDICLAQGCRFRRSSQGFVLFVPPAR